MSDGLSTAELQALRSLLSQGNSAVPPVVPLGSPSPDGLSDVKANLQEAADRILRSWRDLKIPVRVYEENTTSERRGGYQVEQYNLDEFAGFIGEYYALYANTEPHQHISAFFNAIVLLRDDQQRNRDLLVLAMDQYALVQERLTQQGIARAIESSRKERAQQVAAQVLPPVTVPSGPRQSNPAPLMDAVDVDLESDAPAPDTSGMAEIIEEEEVPQRKKQRGKVTDDEELDENAEEEAE